ncbi:LysR family transcriptional regulator [Nocardioides sp. 1609]|uniref:LysR family transcriptional regulator n=1 Tax=Nocardioides sp. 1609 TaxID=2508327 RepID=UPI00106F4E22|nr:LysR family transcriptional regulator [Nocardioides sp. 1609]
MEIRVLRHVLVLAEEQHFGRAAARAHLAQSALSEQLKRLETELGVRLFDRSTRRVTITEAGERFVRHARSIVASADHATTDMRAVADGRTGAVSVGFVGTATYDVLPRVAHYVRTDMPGIDLTLRGELLNPTLLERLSTNELHLALIRPTCTPPAGLLVEHLRSERLVAVLPDTHPLADRRQIRLELLADEDFVIHPSSEQSSIHQVVLSACARAGFIPRSTLEVRETATLAVFVAAGLGVALVPAPARSLQLDGVAYVDLATRVPIDLALARRNSDHSPATAFVARAIRRCVAVAES